MLWGTGRGARAVVLVLVIMLCAACGGGPPAPTSVPTFPVAADGSATSTGPRPDEGAIPDDCDRVISVADVVALFGLPLDSVAVRSTVGVPEPSVGRTERLTCRYSGTAGGPVRGRTLLELNVSVYTDPQAASKQWRVNADAEDGARTELPIGAATAVLIERPGEAVLMVAYNTSNLTLVLPDGPLPGNRPRGDALVDLALRVLPAVPQIIPVPTTEATVSSEAAGTVS